MTNPGSGRRTQYVDDTTAPDPYINEAVRREAGRFLLLG